MDIASQNINQQNVTEAFNRQSGIFDELYSGNPIVQYKRERVRDHLLRYLEPQSSILELNSGTGEDAVFFSRMGHKVHATDISPGMQKILQQKIIGNNLQNLVTTELCSFTEMKHIQNKGPFDAIFSNFAGLNCTDRLDLVLASFNDLLKQGGIVTLVVMPKFCLWETLLLLRGKFKTATRRIFSKNGALAHIEGEYFKCWYYNPSYIIGKLERDFTLLSLEGLCSIVPPSYLEKFPQKHPKLFSLLKGKENKSKSKWPWKYCGDYFIISLKKK